MKVIRNRVLPIGRKFGAINLFGVLFAKNDMYLSKEVLNHEKIHTAQVRELGYLLFYILYLLEWIVWMVRYRFDNMRAYRRISFEKEAYKYGSDLHYLDNRKHFSQWRRKIN